VGERGGEGAWGRGGAQHSGHRQWSCDQSDRTLPLWRLRMRPQSESPQRREGRATRQSSRTGSHERRWQNMRERSAHAHHVHTRTHPQAPAHARTHACAHTDTHSRTHVHETAPTRMHTHAHTCSHRRTRTHARAHTRTPARVHKRALEPCLRCRVPLTKGLCATGRVADAAVSGWQRRTTPSGVLLPRVALPSQRVVSCRRKLPSQSAVAICRCKLPLQAAVAICRCKLPAAASGWSQMGCRETAACCRPCPPHSTPGVSPAHQPGASSCPAAAAAAAAAAYCPHNRGVHPAAALPSCRAVTAAQHCSGSGARPP
jgi:hypothetical protein